MTCPICRSDSWSVVYEGPIRNGRWPETVPGVVRQCAGCGVQRLDDAPKAEWFSTPEYWASLGEGQHATGFSGKAEMERPEVAAMWQPRINGAIAVDIGCGPGAFLDALTEQGPYAAKWGAPEQCIAIDPSPAAAKRHTWYSSVTDARNGMAQYGGGFSEMSLAFILNTLEYVENPVAFLREVSELLAPDGAILLSTANSQDALLTEATAYKPFFYRRAVTWYFDMPSLAACCGAAGLEAIEARFVQRYGLANAVAWKVDGKPVGDAGADEAIDARYRAGIEDRGVSDRMYVLLRRKAA